MGIAIKAELEGLDVTIRTLARFKDSVQKKLLRRAVTKGARVFRAAASQLAPRESGTLARAMDQKIITRDNLVLAIIGPHRGDKRPVVRRGGRMRRTSKRETAAAKASGQQVDYRDASYYAHLVELGHRIAQGGTLARLPNASGRRGSTPRAKNALRSGMGRSGGFVVGKPFIRPAYQQQKQHVENLIREDLTRGIYDEARK